LADKDPAPATRGGGHSIDDRTCEFDQQILGLALDGEDLRALPLSLRKANHGKSVRNTVPQVADQASICFLFK
jgi:hypothetical protein